jgi:hypothetical protein
MATRVESAAKTKPCGACNRAGRFDTSADPERGGRFNCESCAGDGDLYACGLCAGEWFTSGELNKLGECESCEQMRAAGMTAEEIRAVVGFDEPAPMRDHADALMDATLLALGGEARQ